MNRSNHPGVQTQACRRKLPVAGSSFLMLLVCLFAFGTVSAQEQGMYFAKKKYEPTPLRTFAQVKDKLPKPVYDDNEAYLKCYWKAWEIAFKNFYEPTPESGFVSQFADAAFSEHIYLWDDCFITMFLNYAHPYVPGIITLDNFYAKQYKDGEICREIVRATGKDRDLWVNKEQTTLFSRFGHEYNGGSWPVHYKGRPAPKEIPHVTLDALQNPLFSWAELESYKMTGDKQRLQLVWEPLVRYYAALKLFLAQGNGLFLTDWASMDNSPRNIYLKHGGCGVDISSQMVMFGRNLAQMATILGKPAEAAQYTREANKVSERINQLMWDKKEGFYYDLTVDGKPIRIKTVAAFWPLLAQVADKEKAKSLVAELNNPETFNRKHRVPTLAANEEHYDPMGGYWRGAVWAPINTMVVKGLENYGYHALAKEIAMNHLDNVVELFKRTGTVWENYAPDSLSYGVHEGAKVRDEFVGWTGIGPIRYFIEYAIGIRANALTNAIDWNITSNNRVGVEQFWFAGNTVSLVAEAVDAKGKRRVKVTSEKPFNLNITAGGKMKKLQVPANKTLEFLL